MSFLPPAAACLTLQLSATQLYLYLLCTVAPCSAALPFCPVLPAARARRRPANLNVCLLHPTEPPKGQPRFSTRHLGNRAVCQEGRVLGDGTTLELDAQLGPPTWP